MAAGNIKGITIEFRGDTSKLTDALRTVKKEGTALDKELKQIDRSLKFNPTSVTLWAQKQKVLTQHISQTEDKLGLLKRQQQEMDARGVDKNSQEYRALEREIIKTENQLKRFQKELKKVGNVKLKALGESFKQVGTHLKNAGQAMKGFSAAGAAVLGLLGALTVKSASWADELNTASKRYSIATGDLQKYAASAQLVDVSVDDIASAETRLKKNMLGAMDGTNEQAQYFQKLGIEITNADGSLRDANDVFSDTIAALGQMENETERDAIAMALMGKNAQALNPLIEDGGETYRRTAQIFDKYNIQFADQETLDNANAFQDSLDTIKAMGGTALQQIGTQLAGTLAPVMEKIVDLAGRLFGWLSTLSPKTLTLIGIIAGVVAAAGPLLITLGQISIGIGAILPMLSALAGPVGLVIAAIAALVAIGVALYKNWDKIVAYGQQLKSELTAAFASLRDKIVGAWNTVKTKTAQVWNAIKTAVMVPVNAVRGFIQTAVAKIRSIWDTLGVLKDKAAATFEAIKDKITHPLRTAQELVTAAINKIKNLFPLKLGKIFSGIKLPHFKISGGKMPWGIGGQGVKPSISIDWYKQGGIFRQPTLLGGGRVGVGEAGAEAVLPLDLLWQHMDAMANSIVNGVVSAQSLGAASGGGGNIVIPVYLYPSGPKMGEEIVRAYDRWKKVLG